MVHIIQGKEVGDIGFGLMSKLFLEPIPPADCDHELQKDADIYMAPPSSPDRFHMPGKKVSDEEAFATMKTALESGSNYWDAGQFYGTPERNSLTLLRGYFEKYPEDADKILLNVKGCFDRARSVADCSPSGVRTSVETCLGMLGSKGKIDQFEPARKDPKVDIEVTMEAFNELIKEGRIGGVALSEVSAETIRRAAKVAKIEAVEIELSLWQTEPLEDGTVQACAELDIPILAYSPLGRGMLTGQFKKLEDITEGDWRKILPRFQPENFATNVKLVNAVEELAKQKGCKPGQIAINWLLALSKRPGMPRIVPIPGTTSVERLRENVVRVELTDEDMAAIDKILAEFPPAGDRYHKQGMQMLDKQGKA